MSLSKPAANFGVAVTGEQPRPAAGRPRRGREPAPGRGRAPVQRESLSARLRGSGDAWPARHSPRPAITTSSSTARGRAGAGAFTFRFWIERHDAAERSGSSPLDEGVLRISVRDTGSGVDRSKNRLFVDGRRRSARFDAGRGLVLASDPRPAARTTQRSGFSSRTTRSPRTWRTCAGFFPTLGASETAFVVR